MTTENEKEQTNEEAPPESFIQIIFTGAGSVIMSMQTGQVTPLQLIAAAKYLELMGEDGLRQQAAQAQQSKIITPEMVLQ